MKNSATSTPNAKPTSKKTLSLWLLTAATSLNLMACSPQSLINKMNANSAASSADAGAQALGDLQVRDLNAILNSRATGTQKAQLLVEFAETLIRANTFMHAAKIIDLALIQDPQHVRAQFWKTTLAPQFVLEGISDRIEPLARQRSDRYADYLQTTAVLKQHSPAKDLVAFMHNGQADLDTESKVQRVVDQYLVKLAELRTWLKVNRRQALQFKVVIDDKESIQEDGTRKTCTAKEVQPRVWQMENCSNFQMKAVRMNAADFEAARQMISGYIVYFGIANSYSLDGLFKIAGTLPAMSVKQRIDSVLADRRAGVLRTPSYMKFLSEATADAVVAVRRAQALQQQICPQGLEAKDQRPGYLFKDGLCVESSDTVTRELAIAEQLARGQRTPIDFIIHGQRHTVSVDPTALTERPVANLRDLGPIHEDSCGLVRGLGDGRAGGFFPGGELNQLLDAESGMCP